MRNPVNKSKLMKSITFALVAGLLCLVGISTAAPVNHYKTTWSSFDQPSDHPPESITKNNTCDFKGTSLDQILEIYEAVSSRTIIHGPLPSVVINLRVSTPVDKIELLQLLDSALAENGIAMVLSGDNAVKVVTADRAAGESPPEIELSVNLLPDSSSAMSRTVQLKRARR
jgi:type II secretory pathway component GspD/PulD (secretin)